MASSDYAFNLDFGATTTSATGASQWFLNGADANTGTFGTAVSSVRAGEFMVTNNDVQIESFTNTTAASSAFDLTSGISSSQRMTAIATEGSATFRVSDFNFGGGVLGLKHALMQIFKQVPKDLIKSDDDKKLVIAKEKSEKLLKSWLSPKEYQGLLNKGQLEIPSVIDEDTIFIIKRDPNEMVQVKKKGEYSHRLCAIAEDLEMPVGDQLLSKLLLLKTDEQRFKEIAIKH